MYKRQLKTRPESEGQEYKMETNVDRENENDITVYSPSQTVLPNAISFYRLRISQKQFVMIHSFDGNRLEKNGDHHGWCNVHQRVPNCRYSCMECCTIDRFFRASAFCHSKHLDFYSFNDDLR